MLCCADGCGLADSSNTINLKLFPTRPPPAPVYAWHVPLSTVDLTSIASSSDLTLTRIIPHIDGIASVYQVSQLADTDLGLTRKAIQHLLYYGCVLLLDIFQFGAVYAPTAEMGTFIEDEEAQEEAVRYFMETLPSSKEMPCRGNGRQMPYTPSYLCPEPTPRQNTHTILEPTIFRNENHFLKLLE